MKKKESELRKRSQQRAVEKLYRRKSYLEGKGFESGKIQANYRLNDAKRIQ